MSPTPVVDVLAGVIRDARGRILLARRTAGRDLAGRWEFPGGKREHGETPETALVRELREELGIDVEVGAHLITVPHRRPDRRMRLDVRHVRGWRGTARGLEGQALAWVPPERLSSYQMPPADLPVVAALQQPDHCLVTPAPGDDDGAWLGGLDAALAAGVRRVQLRAPALDPVRWNALAAAAVERCRRARAQVLVNGDAALAAELGTGLHLPSVALLVQRRRPVADAVPLSASCHDAAQLRHAETLGCDFALLGPLKPTPSHPGAAGIGWDGFAALREQVALPIYAIGGLGRDDIAEARRHGAQGIAAIRGLWS